MGRKILFVAMHPDDETIGAGGTILKHRAKGDEIFWLILTNISTENGWEKSVVQERQNEIKKVGVKYGFQKTICLDFPATKLDEIPMGKIIDRVSKAILELTPNIVYLQNRSDVHTDHQIGFNAVYSCTKNFRYPFVEQILMYETLSETDFAPSLNENAFTPNVFIDISDYIEEKLEIMKLYKSEVMPSPYPRSLNTIRALAQVRGSRIGKHFAEAFMSIFEKR